MPVSNIMTGRLCVQVTEAAEIKQRWAKNCTKYAATLEARRKLDLLLLIARFDDSDGAMRGRSWSWVSSTC